MGCDFCVAYLHTEARPVIPFSMCLAAFTERLECFGAINGPSTAANSAADGCAHEPRFRSTPVYKRCSGSLLLHQFAVHDFSRSRRREISLRIPHGRRGGFTQRGLDVIERLALHDHRFHVFPFILND